MKERVEQSGRSMIEMLGVLAIVGVLSIGGVLGYKLAMDKYKTITAMEQIQMLLSSIRSLYATNQNYENLSTTALINMGLLQGDKNLFGGDIVVNGSSDGTFTIDYKDVPRSACSSMSLADWGSAESGFVGLKVGDVDVVTDGKAASVTTVANACKEVGPAGGTISWAFDSRRID